MTSEFERALDAARPATTYPIQRVIGDDQLKWIMNHCLFKEMEDGIACGQILPALRKREVHFYEGGARLLRFAAYKVFTHETYINGSGSNECEVGSLDPTIPQDHPATCGASPA